MNWRPEGPWASPTNRRARLSLAGLVIADHRGAPRDEVGRFLPWRELRPFQQGFVVVNEEGGRLHRGRRLLIPTCPTTRGRRLAKRAYARAMHRSFADGSIDVTVHFRSTRRDRQIGLLATGGMVAAMLILLWPLLQGYFAAPGQGGTGGHSLLAWITIGGAATTAVLFVGAYATIMYRLTDGSVRRLRFRGHEIEAALDDGRLVRQRWSDLHRLTQGSTGWKLDFVDGTRLRVLGRGGVSAILRAAQRIHEPAAEERRRPAGLRVAVRVFLWCQLGGMLAAWLSATYGVGRSPGASYIVIGFGFPALLLFTLWGSYLQAGEPMPVPWKRRRRGPSSAG